jgi:hypothetical protein
MEDKERDGNSPTTSGEVVIDANIYGLLLEVISRNEDNMDKQQKSLKDIAGAMYRPTLPRRLFRVLFPSIESTRRVR